MQASRSVLRRLSPPVDRAIGGADSWLRAGGRMRERCAGDSVEELRGTDGLRKPSIRPFELFLLCNKVRE